MKKDKQVSEKVKTVKEALENVKASDKQKDIEQKEAQRPEVITYEYLDKFSYGNDLQAELEALEVGDCYKGGKKKKDIIASALTRLAEIQKLEKEGASTEEAKTKAVESESLKKHTLAEENKRRIAEKEAEEEAKVKKLVDLKLDKDGFKERIGNIDLNIAGGNPKFTAELHTLRRIWTKAYSLKFKEEFDK